jgi:alpha-2-macroglobulin
MTRSATVLVLLLALLAVGCPGQKPSKAPSKPELAAPSGPLVWRVSKSGLGFRISNADAHADAPPERKVARTTALGADDTQKILARLPSMPASTDDAKDFAMRDKSIPAPRTGKAVTEPFPPPAGPPPQAVAASGPLQIERHAPEGPVSLAPHLTVTFSQPMVAVTSHGDLARDRVPVTLSPEPKGTWRWLGTRTLMFQPDGRFPMATEYAVRVPAGTRSITGGELAKDVGWTFTTPPPSVTRSHPRGASQPLDPLLFVELDQRIDPEVVLSSIEVSGVRGGGALRLATADEVEADDAVRRLAQMAEPGRWLAFRPTTKLPTATAIKVRLKAGTRSAEGPRTTDQDQAFSFTTFGPLRVTQSSCADLRRLCVPLEPLYLWFSNAIDRKTFKPELVSVTPEIPGMKVDVSGSAMTLRGRTKGRTRYTVVVNRALGDTHGQTMGEDAKVTAVFGSAEPMLFGAEGPLVVLDPASPKTYPVYSINEPQLRARIYTVTPEDYARYVTYTNEWERPRKIAPPGKLVTDRILSPRKAPDELVATAIDLAPALAKGLGQALVIVEPTRTMPKDYRRPELHVWVQSTGLGVSAYVEDDRVTGWVTRLTDGAPIEGATVSLLGAGDARTDKQGLARVALSDKAGKMLVARSGKDVAIVPEGHGGSSYVRRQTSDAVRWFVFDDRGMYKPGEDVRLKGWVRRGGAARGGDLDAVPAAPGKRVGYKVKDPRGAEIASGDATLDRHGGFDASFKLPGNANLGHARVELSLEGTALAGSRHAHGFQVQEFRRPEFEVSARSSEGPHVVGGHAVATVAASYYAGGGLPAAPVSWSVRRETVGFSPPNRGGFHFGPEPVFFWSFRHGPGADREVKTESWTAQTDSQGVHRLRLDFDALEPSYPMSLDLTAHVEDVNRQQWAGRTSMLVHPGDHYVGLRTAKSFVVAGEPIDVDVLVSDIEGRAVPGRRAVVKAARLEWDGDEAEEKEVDIRTCEVESPATGGVETARCSLPTREGGRYRVWAVVADARGRKSQTATTLWVMGKETPKDRRLGGDEVTIVPDRTEYLPGAAAELLVVSPFSPAEGVLTVRRQGIVHTERFTMRGATHALTVKLDEGLVPNAEIHVDLVGSRPREGAGGEPDPRLPRQPAFARGSAPLVVKPVTRTLTVRATPREPALEPGGKTTLDVAVKDSAGRGVGGAQVAVVVVDEAVLALSGKKTPDPMALFYAPRPSGVRDLGMRDRIILADPDLVSPAGGAGGAFEGMVHAQSVMMPGAQPMAPPPPSAEGTPIEPSMVRSEHAKNGALADDSVSGATTAIAVRSDLAALAVFAPRVLTDAQGRASIPVKLPDNLTRYRVMAIAAAGEKQFGANESTITARLPVMVRPSAPRFLNFGDRFELPVIVQNQTDAPVDVGVVVRATNAALDESSGKRVTVAANDRVEVRFGAAAAKAGTARFQIGVASGAFADASLVELPVYTPATSEAFATYGEIDSGAVVQPVKMPQGVFPQFGGLEVTTSSTQLQALTDAVLYLVHYPFECNEQLASRVLALAALKDVLTAFQAKDLPSADAMRESVKLDFEKLKRRQHGSGGWGFWQEQPWPYLTAHVAHALVRAREKGYAPDPQMLERAKAYLRQIESHIPAWYGEDAKRALIAYALYVRNRMGDADPARARRLVAEAGGVDKLPIEATGWIWPTVSGDKASQSQNEQIRRHVENRVTETAGAAHFVSGYKDSSWVLLHSDRRADGVLLEAMIGDQPQSTVIPKLVKGLLGHRKAGRWTNTQENAFVLLALDRYFHTYEKVTPDFVARVWLGDRFAGQHAFKGRTTEQHHVGIPMQFLAKELGSAPQSLAVAKNGPGRLYYRVAMQYAPKDLKLPPADHGFVVTRAYEAVDEPDDVKRDADGTWRVKAGARVRVRLTMVAPSRRYHVALVDPMPAGLEAMNAELAVTGEIPKDPKAEATQGKYWFWQRTWYEHQNMKDERVEAFASLLWEGVWDYAYVARATTPGSFVVPPAKAEEMYSPETFGRSAGDRLVVE